MKIFSCFIVLVVLGVTGFQYITVANSIEKPTGFFIRAIGNKIYATDFLRETEELLYESPIGKPIYGPLSQFDDKKIMFSVGLDREIFTLDIVSKSLESIGYGVFPMYFPKYEKMVYFGRDSQGKGALLVANEYLQNPTTIVSSGDNDPSKLVRLSDDEVLFQMSSSKTKRFDLWKYTLSTQALEPLNSQTECSMLYIKATSKREILCESTDLNSDDYYFLNIDNGERRDVSRSSYMNIGAYVEEINSLIIQITYSKYLSEKTDLWIFDVKTKKKLRLSSNMAFGVHSFIYFEPAYPGPT